MKIPKFGNYGRSLMEFVTASLPFGTQKRKL